MKRIYFFLAMSNLHTKDFMSIQKLNNYKDYIVQGTLSNQDFSFFKRTPLSRYETFSYCFNHFEQNHQKVIVELGTTRSFVDGAYEGCNLNDVKYWQPNNPEVWDWGAGFFTRLAAESLSHLKPKIYTVDLDRNHINRCKIITEEYKNFISYNVSYSTDFLKSFNGEIDLLYIDTGDMWPIEPTAEMQLEEAKIIIQRNLISENGLILIDDIMNSTPKKFGETSDFGKAKYSIPYFLENGFEIIMAEYQYILKRKAAR